MTSPSPSAGATVPITISSMDKPAGFGLRIGAKITDVLVVSVISYCCLILVSLLNGVFLADTVLFASLILLPACSWIFYFGYFNARGRRTLGYLAAGLNAINNEGAPLTLKQSMWRAVANGFCWPLILIGVGGINYLMPLWDPLKRTGHDRLTNTRVVQAGSPKRIWLVVAGMLYVLWNGVLTAEGVRVLQAYYIPAASMEPTLVLRDRILANHLAYTLRPPRFGEIVFFRVPQSAQSAMASPGTIFVKRCIGTPGEIVYVLDRKLYRLGENAQGTQPQSVTEPYVKWDSFGPPSYDMKIVDGKVLSREYDASHTAGLWCINGVPVPEDRQEKITAARPEAVPPGQYLMLGDYRNDSNDSHVWGFVPDANITGRASFIYWPPQRIGPIAR